MRRYTDLRYTDAKGGTPSWSVIRHYILKRDGYRCAMCGDPANEVDHKWPRFHGGDDQEANLQSLCGRCNKQKGNQVVWWAASEVNLMYALAAANVRLEAEHDRVQMILEELCLRDNDYWEPHRQEHRFSQRRFDAFLMKLFEALKAMAA